MKTLGIDLGSNSVGWAVINEDGPQKAGVLVFEEGVNREQSDSLETPAAARRAKRMARRLKFRRKLRRFKVLDILVREKMCPLTLDELKAWKQDDVFPKDNAAYLAWLKSTDSDNPYADRAAAASHKVDKEILGRAIYHLAQRRGFKSGRKDADRDENGAPDKKLEGLKSEIQELKKELDRTGLTLGQHFCKEIERGNKVRTCHTGRKQHYIPEWARIAEVQGLSQKLTKTIADALFFQRPLREQSWLVGKCPLEPKRNRAQLGHPDFEAFRALSFVNNIRVVNGEDSVPLTPEQRAVAAACFIRKSPFEFKAIRKELEKTFKNELKGVAFNYENNTSLSPSKVTAALREALESGGRSPVSADVTQTAFDALTFFDDNDKLAAWAQIKLGLSAEQAAAFAKIRVPEGRASYSLHAIRLINRFLRKGLELSQAIFLAKCPEVIPDFDAKEDQIIAAVAEQGEQYRASKRAAYSDPRTENRLGVLSLEKRLRSLFDSYGVGKDAFNTLYFRDPKADSSYAAVKPGGAVLPPVNLGMIRNPLVQRSMTMLRRLVNELRRKGAIDAETRIHIELARDVNSRNDRMAIKEWQKRNEQKRAEAKAKLQEHGIATPADDLILKYVLAEEQEWTCPYTGRKIGIAELIGGGFDIEHTIPRSRSGDDSQANKTLCEIAFNRNTKKGLMPSELPNHDDIIVRLRPWEGRIAELKTLREKQARIARSIPGDNPEARSRARQKMLVTKLELRYWEDKYDRFVRKPEDVTPGFISRQLVDTGIMTRHAVALLKTVYRDVYPVNGVAVAFARKMWKVQGADEVKDRTEHTHHAKDALVIAALTRDRFQRICTELKADDERKNPSFNIPPPDPNFAQTVHDMTEKILVKHITRHNELKQTWRNSIRLSSPKGPQKLTRAPAAGSTVRGQLHNETFYGKIKRPGETETICVIRRELGALKDKEVEAIIDPVIRQCVSDAVAQQGGDIKKAAEAGVRMPSGTPIKKVRIEAHVTNPKALRDHEATPSVHTYKTPYWVQATAGNNFRLAVYLTGDSSPLFFCETLLDHAQGKVPAPPEQAGFAGYILPGALAIAVREPGEQGEPGFPLEQRLYEVVKFAQGRITLRFHREARRMTDLEKALSESGKNKNGESSVDFDAPHELLRLRERKAWASFLFEGIHFRMGLDGEITFLTA